MHHSRTYEIHSGWLRKIENRVETKSRLSMGLRPSVCPSACPSVYPLVCKVFLKNICIRSRWSGKIKDQVKMNLRLSWIALIIPISKIICPISGKNPMVVSLFRPELVSLFLSMYFCFSFTSEQKKTTKNNSNITGTCWKIKLILTSFDKQTMTQKRQTYWHTDSQTDRHTDKYYRG